MNNNRQQSTEAPGAAETAGVIIFTPMIIALCIYMVAKIVIAYAHNQIW